MLKKSHIYLLLIAVLFSCSKKDEIVPVKSAEKSIISFTLNSLSPVVKANIDSVKYTVTVSVPIGTDISRLSPTITISKLASISPSSGTVQDFTSPVVYTVTAENGTVQTYTVKVNIAKSSSKSITSFSFSSLPKVVVTIDSTKKTITATLPEGTDLTKLAPTIVTSNKATVNPASGQAQDFTNPVTYNVSAEDGTVQSYIVTLNTSVTYKNSIYFVYGKTLFACNLTTGKINWTFNIGYNNAGKPSAPTVKDGIVYVAGNPDSYVDNYFYAIDGNTGVKKWEFKTINLLRRDPIVAGGIVYFCDNTYETGNIYAVDIKTGLKKWSIETSPRYATTNSTVVDGVLYTTATDYSINGSSTANTTIYALDALTGQKKWEYNFDTDLASRPCVVNGLLYFGLNTYIYALNTSNGNVKWKTNKFYGNGTSLSVIDGVVYSNAYNTGNTYLYALDAITGTIKWSTTIVANTSIRKSPFISNGILYIGTEDNKILAMDAKTGSKKWTFTTELQYLISSPIVANGVVYTIGSDNNASNFKFYAVDALKGSLMYSFSMNYILANNISNKPISDLCIVDSNGQIYHSSESGE